MPRFLASTARSLFVFFSSYLQVMAYMYVTEKRSKNNQIASQDEGRNLRVVTIVMPSRSEANLFNSATQYACFSVYLLSIQSS